MARTGTRPQRASIEVRNAQAISMALAGASYDDIAQALGYANRQRRLESRQQRSTRPNGRRRRRLPRALEMSRLDALQSSLWARRHERQRRGRAGLPKIVCTRIKLLGLLELPPRL